MAKSGSTMASATAWKARSQAAYQGYSHLSGMEMTSSLTMWNQSRLRTSKRVRVRVGWAWCSSSQRSRSKW